MTRWCSRVRNVRIFVLQILLVGRLGVALQTIYGTGASNSRAAEVETILARVKEETAQIEGHLTDQSPDVWLQLESLKGVSSATDLLREFVQALNAAWPTSWLELAVKQPNEAAGAMANGCISETNLNLKEPLEITANWPFKQRVEGSFEHVRDVSQIFVKVWCQSPCLSLCVCAHAGSVVTERAPRRHDAVSSDPAGQHSHALAALLFVRPHHLTGCATVLGPDVICHLDQHQSREPSWRIREGKPHCCTSFVCLTNQLVLSWLLLDRRHDITSTRLFGYCSSSDGPDFSSYDVKLATRASQFVKRDPQAG